MRILLVTISLLTLSGIGLGQQASVSDSTGSKIQYPNLKLLPVAVVALGMSWSYFEDVGTIEHGDPNTRDWGEHNRKLVLASAFLVAGITDLWISFDRVEVRASTQSVSVSYRF